jgi:hypothetical protein
MVEKRDMSGMLLKGRRKCHANGLIRKRLQALVSVNNFAAVSPAV